MGNFLDTLNINEEVWADFLYYLIRTLGVEAIIDENFDDINSDAYYYREIAIAKKLGITKGMGGNNFKSHATITRQDMMVLTERALRIVKKLERQDTVSELQKFTDVSLIADYAEASVTTVVQEGFIIGTGEKPNQLGTTSAEVAVFLCNYSIREFHLIR